MNAKYAMLILVVLGTVISGCSKNEVAQSNNKTIDSKLDEKWFYDRDGKKPGRDLYWYGGGEGQVQFLIISSIEKYGDTRRASSVITFTDESSEAKAKRNNIGSLIAVSEYDCKSKKKRDLSATGHFDKMAKLDGFHTEKANEIWMLQESGTIGRQVLDFVCEYNVSEVSANDVPQILNTQESDKEVLTESVPTQAGQSSTSPTSNQLNVQCAATKDCVSAMLNSARSENFDAALEVAKQVDTLNKPARGDRKQARKLNDEGLEALRQSNYKEAIEKFRSAKEIDSVDEEIVGNLTLALIESKNYKEAEVVAYDGVLLNPRRANFWWLIAIIKQKQGMPKEALQSLWLSMQFTKDKPRLLGIIEKKAGEEKDDQLRSMYSEAMGWLGSGQRPKF